jgi:poly [ADP-ribose] polymerase 2/3/4
MSMMTAVRNDRFILADISSNSNKYWSITLFDDHTIETHWGRVGDAGQQKQFALPSADGAQAFYESKCREKERKGYRPQRTLEAGGMAESRRLQKQELAAVAQQQISAGCPVTAELIAVLAKENIHHILASTTMTYDTSQGTFSTPLGIVTADALQDARRLLSEIGGYVSSGAYDDDQLTRCLNDYLMLIPQAIGRRRPDPRELYPDLAAVQRQNDLLDALDASLQQVLTAPKPGSAEPAHAPAGVFDCSLTLVNDGREIDRIRRKYRETQQSIHGSAVLDVKRVFLVEIASMRRAFEQDGARLSNIWELWHGSKKGNLLSILSKGFVIPPSNAAHCTGRMFGNGVYFSDQSTKSLNHSWGHWDGRYDDNCFMFLCNVGLGRYHVPKAAGECLPHPGTDSTFAKAGHSGVLNNEMVVYRTSVIDPVFLVEFSNKGR